MTIKSQANSEEAMYFDLEKIFTGGENDRVEFKRSLAEEKEIIETVGAFLNHKGGLIIIGYDEKKKKSTGLEIGKETVQQLVNKIKLTTNPQVIVDTYEIESDGKILLAVDVMEYPIKPVAVQGKYFRRRINSNHTMSPAEISQLHLFSLNSSWDYQLSYNHSIDDLDMELANSFIEKLNRRRGKPITDSTLHVLEKYELIRDGKPTFAALLLFPKNPSFILDVQLGLFENETTIKKDKNIKKSVLLEIDEIMDFITAYITKEFVFTGKAQRDERWQFPIEAIREIVINAVVHRDYQEGTHTQIKVFRDRISFWNSGKLPPDLTIDDIKSGIIQSRPRNRLLAQVFKDMGLIEKYGSGIRRVIEDFNDYGLMEPVFEEKFGGFYVNIFDKPNVNDKMYTPGTTQEIQDTTPKTVKTNQEMFSTTQENQKADDVEKGNGRSTRERIVTAIKSNPSATRKQLARIIGISENGVKYHLEKLKQVGHIARVGSTKGGFWKVNR